MMLFDGVLVVEIGITWSGGTTKDATGWQVVLEGSLVKEDQGVNEDAPTAPVGEVVKVSSLVRNCSLLPGELKVPSQKVCTQLGEVAAIGVQVAPAATVGV
ncbi:MAG: hypothetical protein HEQ39_16525 [Rhizobacter sp.]